MCACVYVWCNAHGDTYVSYEGWGRLWARLERYRRMNTVTSVLTVLTMTHVRAHTHTRRVKMLWECLLRQSRCFPLIITSWTKHLICFGVLPPWQFIYVLNGFLWHFLWQLACLVSLLKTNIGPPWNVSLTIASHDAAVEGMEMLNLTSFYRFLLQWWSYWRQWCPFSFISKWLLVSRLYCPLFLFCAAVQYHRQTIL